MKKSLIFFTFFLHLSCSINTESDSSQDPVFKDIFFPQNNDFDLKIDSLSYELIIESDTLLYWYYKMSLVNEITLNRKYDTKKKDIYLLGGDSLATQFIISKVLDFSETIDTCRNDHLPLETYIYVDTIPVRNDGIFIAKDKNTYVVDTMIERITNRSKFIYHIKMPNGSVFKEAELWKNALIDLYGMQEYYSDILILSIKEGVFECQKSNWSNWTYGEEKKVIIPEISLYGHGNLSPVPFVEYFKSDTSEVYEMIYSSGEWGLDFYLTKDFFGLYGDTTYMDEQTIVIDITDSDILDFTEYVIEFEPWNPKFFRDSTIDWCNHKRRHFLRRKY